MRSKSMLRVAGAIAALALVATACGGDDTDDTAGEATTPAEEPAEEEPAEEEPAEEEPAEEEPAEEEPEEDGAAGDFTLVSDGTLTVCTDAPYKPMEFEQDGEFTGFDIELMRAISDEIGLGETQVINSGFDGITSGSVFAANTCDIAAASITITEEREENIDFTDPYFKADQSLLVKADSGFGSLEGLAGERLGVQTGTTGEMYAQENAPEDTEIVSFDNPGDLFTALEAGDISGILQDLVVNQGRTLDDDTVEVVETFPTDEQYGFATPEGDAGDALLQAVNDALATLMEDGTYDELFNEWFPTTDPQQ